MAKKRANGEGHIKTYLDAADKTETSVRKVSIPQEAVAPQFDPHLKVYFYSKKASKTEVFDAFWSCWADSNRRPHPYQKAVDAFTVCPFIPRKILQSLLMQGIGGFSCVSALYLIPGCFAWI